MSPQPVVASGDARLSSDELLEVEREIDRELLRRARLGYALQPLVILTVAAMTLRGAAPWVPALFVGTSVALAAVRVAFDLASDRWIEGRRSLFRAVFAALSIFAGLSWSAFACFGLTLQTANSALPWLVVICTGGFAGGVTSLLAPRLWLLRATLLAFELPLLLALLYDGAASSLMLAPFVLVQLSFQLMAGRKLYGGYISALHANALLTSQERRSSLLAAAVSASDEAIEVMDASGTVIYANAASQRLTARLAGDADDAPMSTRSTLDPPDAWVTVRETGLWRGRSSAVDAKGTRIEVDATLSTVPSADPKGGLFVAVRRDVTEQHALESRLRIAERMVSMGTLASGVAHEINNPLSFVLANVELGLEATRAFQAAVHDARGHLPASILLHLEQLEQVIEALAEAEHGALRIRAIVRDVKSFGRPEDEALGPVNLTKVVESALAMTGSELRYRCQVRRDFGNVPSFVGNEGRLQQVLVNLIINAAHAIKEGDADANAITLRTRVNARHQVTIEVTDTGCGIPRSALGRVFDPFFTTKKIGRGTGLGLSICHGIVASFGGEITIESVEGKGTTVTVSLPLATEPVTIAPPASEERPTARKHILVIDDEPAVRNVLKRALSRDNDVTLAETGAEALLRIGRDQFDVVLCDLMMPNMTGMDFYEHIERSRPELRARIVFVTGGGFTDHARQFLERVPNPRIDKPFDVEKIRSLVGGFTKRPASSRKQLGESLA